MATVNTLDNSRRIPQSIQAGLIVVLMLSIAAASYVAFVLPNMSQTPIRQWYLRNNMCMIDQAAQACKKAKGHFPGNLEEVREFLPGGKSVDGNGKVGEVRLMAKAQPLNPYSYRDDWLKMERFDSRAAAIATCDNKVSRGEIRYCHFSEPDGYMLIASDLSGKPMVWESTAFNERADWYAKFNK